jgi:hypothetical protein
MGVQYVLMLMLIDVESAPGPLCCMGVSIVAAVCKCYDL